MGKSQRLGYEGEIGILSLLHDLYPEGHPARDAIERSRSKGVNDVGDISAVPYTMIECKNSKASESTLLDNAEWKSENSGRPMWWLTKKEPGYGANNAHLWNGMCTVEGLFKGYALTPVRVDGTEYPLTIADVPQACRDGLVIDARIDARFQFQEPSGHPWTVRLIFANFMQKASVLRRELISEPGLFFEPLAEERLIPIVIYPRTGREPNQWYAWTLVAGMVRMLETVGSTPELISNYTTDSTAE